VGAIISALRGEHRSWEDRQAGAESLNQDVESGAEI
jgi:hypothetical protein